MLFALLNSIYRHKKAQNALFNSKRIKWEQLLTLLFIFITQINLLAQEAQKKPTLIANT